MKKKAAATFREAMTLVQARQFSGAANRFYYALFQALVGEYKARGFEPGNLGRVDPDHPDSWRHEAVVGASARIGVSGRDHELLIEAKTLRVKADYSRDPVSEDDLYAIVQDRVGARKILVDLGANL